MPHRRRRPPFLGGVLKLKGQLQTGIERLKHIEHVVLYMSLLFIEGLKLD